MLDPSELTEEELRPTERQSYFMPRCTGGPSGERAATKVMAERRKQYRAAAQADVGAPQRATQRGNEGEAPEATADDRDDAGVTSRQTCNPLLHRAHIRV